MALEEIVQRISAKADFSEAAKEFDRLGDKSAGLGDKIGAAMKGAALGAAAGVAAVGGSILAAGMAWDEVADTIAQKTGATGDRLAELEDVVRKVGSSGPAALGDVASAVAGLAQRLDLPASAMERLSGQVVDLARMTGGSVEGLTDTVSRMGAQWGLSGDQLSAAMDRMFVASQRSGVSFDQLAQNAVKFGPAMRELGFSIDDTTALMASMGKSGVNVDAAMAGLQRSMVNLVKAGATDLPAALREGMEAIRAAGSESEAAALAIELFGVKAGPQMASAIRSGAMSIDDMVSALQDADGAIQNTARSTDDFPEKFRTMVNKVTIALAPLGSALMDGIGRAMDAVAPIVERGTAMLTEGIDLITRAWSNPNLDASGWQGFVARIVDVVRGAVDWVREHWPEIQAAIADGLAAAREAWESVGRPIFDALVQFVGDAVELFERNWPQIAQTVRDAMTAVQQVIQTVVGIVQAVWRQWGDEIVNYLRETWDNVQRIVQGALDVIQGIIRAVTAILRGDWGAAWDAIVGIVRGAWEVITGLISQALNLAQTVFTAGWDAMRSLAGQAWEALVGIVRSGIDTTLEFLAAMPGRILSALSALPSLLIDLGGALLRGLLSGITTAAEALWGWLRELPGRIVATIGSLGLTLYGRAQELIGGFLGSVQSFAEGVWAFFRNLPGEIVARLGSLAGVLFNAGRELIQGLIDGIRSMAASAASSVVNVVRSAASAVNPVNVVRAVVPGLGVGGIVMPRPGGVPIVTAEGGHPEVVVPLDPKLRGRALQLLAQAGLIDDVLASRERPVAPLVERASPAGATVNFAAGAVTIQTDTDIDMLARKLAFAVKRW